MRDLGAKRRNRVRTGLVTVLIVGSLLLVSVPASAHPSTFDIVEFVDDFSGNVDPSRCDTETRGGPTDTLTQADVRAHVDVCVWDVGDHCHASSEGRVEGRLPLVVYDWTIDLIDRRWDNVETGPVIREKPNHADNIPPGDLITVGTWIENMNAGTDTSAHASVRCPT